MRYKAIVSYDGTNYIGWQTQQNGNSIQEQIERVLTTIHKEPVEIAASGRTDAKVHAIGQVFHFDLIKDIECENLKTGMNALLPKDIRIIDIKIVDDEFHARFHAISKRYDYYVSYDILNPFINNYMAKESRHMDIDKMKEAASIFIGTHDFTSFTSSKIDPRKSRVKTIHKIEILEEGNNIHFILEGSSFLRYMVRMIVQTIIEAGKGNIEIDTVKDMLEMKDKHACRFKAVPQGLYLVEVKYEH